LAASANWNLVMSAKSLKALRSNLRFVTKRFPYAILTVATFVTFLTGAGFLIATFLWAS